MQHFFHFLIATVIYYLSVKVGSFLAVDPGFSSVGWFASGIVLALVISWGKPALIGGVVGSFVASLGSFSAVLNTDIVISTIIAIGTAIQLSLAWCLTKKVFGEKIEPSKIESMLRWLMYIGPVSCLVPATIGSIALLALSGMEVERADFIWLQWWISDTLGTLYFCPLFLTLTRKIAIQRSARLQLVVPSTAIFLIICVIFFFSRNEQLGNQRFNNEQALYTLATSMKSARDDVDNDLASLIAFFSTRDQVSPEEFAIFSKTISGRQPIYRALEWIPLITHDQRSAFEDKIRAQGFPNFYVKGFDQEGYVGVALPADFYFPVTYIEPLLSNEAALGLDLSSNPKRLAAIQKAVSRKQGVATAPITLVQKTNKPSSGVLVLAPVFKSFETPEQMSMDEHMSLIKGLVLVVVDIDKLLDQVLTKNRLLGSFNSVQLTDQMDSLAHSVGELADLEQSAWEINWFGRQWLIKTGFNRLQVYGEKDYISLGVLVAGFALGVIVIIYIFTAIGFNSQLKVLVQKKTSALASSMRKAKDSSKAKSLFLANMSHEFRTPLNIIMGFAQLGIEDSRKDSKFYEYFVKIDNASSSLLNIMNNILDWSKLEVGKVSLASKPCNFSLFVEKLEGMYSLMAQRKGIDFSITVEGKPVGCLSCDEERLTQVLVNLCNNAIKFTEKGGVKIVFSFDSVSENKERLNCSVTDTGVGIDPEGHEKLFQAFTQSDESLARQYQGTGLGLSIASSLVKMMGGEIKVKSEVGQGTCFYFSVFLPIASNQQEKAPEPAHYLKLNDKVILLVEDNPLNQEIATAQLKKYEAKVEVAQNGQEAIEFLRHHDDVDLILMDMQMPIMDGYQATKEIKANKNWKLIPIIAISANAQKDDIDNAFTMGVDGYLTKPIDMALLNKIITKYFEDAA